MDLRENRIVDAISQLASEEAAGLLQAAAESTLLVPVPSIRGYLCRELGEFLQRVEAGDTTTPARQPGLREMDLGDLAQWVMGAALLNNVKVEGGIERLTDAIIDVVAANAAATLGALAAAGISA